MKEFVATIINRLTRSKGTKHPEGQPANGDTSLINLLQMIDQTEEVELSCDEVFSLVDQYADRVVRDEDVADLYPLVKKHLDRCIDCKEEYEALVRILDSSANDLGYAGS